ncbi:34297_t:CDS:2, partial [Gigaspora margarita]
MNLEMDKTKVCEIGTKKEAIMDEEELDKSNQEMLVEDKSERNKGNDEGKLENKEETKGPTRPGLAKSKEASNVGCYQDGISIKRNKMLKEHSRHVKCDDSDSQFDPIKKDEHEVSKNDKRLSFDNEEKGPEHCNE